MNAIQKYNEFKAAIAHEGLCITSKRFGPHDMRTKVGQCWMRLTDTIAVVMTIENEGAPK